MSDYPMLSIGHHLIPLLSLPGAAGALVGKAHLASIKVACKTAERTHGALKMAGRYEVAFVPEIPDFFDPRPELNKARAIAWEAIRTTPNLQWVIITRHPEHVSHSLPATWMGKGFKNLCVGLIVESDGRILEKIQALKNAPVTHRMILLTRSSPVIEIKDLLKGIDWVVFYGNSGDKARAEIIMNTCREIDVAFYFLPYDEGAPLATINDMAEDDTSWANHPFGNKINLLRPTLPDLVRMPCDTPKQKTAPADAVMGNASPTPAANDERLLLGNISENSQTLNTVDATEFVNFELMNPEPNAPEVINETDHNDFNRLDGVVRRGLATFIEVGRALAEIRDRELWFIGGHTSWAAYCQAVGELSKSHANRLINSSETASRLALVTPIGVTLQTESQVRPLCRLKTQELQVTALSRAVERANGGQPTARLISDVVAELMADEILVASPKPNRKQLLAEKIHQIRARYAAGARQEEIESLLNDIEVLLKISHPSPHGKSGRTL